MKGDILDTTFEGKEVELSDNIVRRGDDINVTAKDPTMKNIHVGAGWDTNAFNADSLDVDISLFMLNKDGRTRMDEDFVFYNNRQAFDGGVKHNFDSRTGAGEGDDESILIDIQSVPFDIVRLAFVISIYKGEEKGQNLAMLRNTFIRLVNSENGFELLRYVLDKDLEDKLETAVLAAVLDREGPKWHFRALAEMADGGLKTLAERYGIIIAAQ